MPELPEVETIRRGLQSSLPGRRIVRVRVHREDSVAEPSARKFAAQLEGKEFVAARRRGKYLLFDLAPSGVLVVHLRMSGRLLLMRTPQPKGAVMKSRSRRAKNDEVVPLTTFERIRFELDRDVLVFDDMRVFGRAWYIPESQGETCISGIADLGPEPLEGLSPDELLEKFRKKKQAIKTTLLDQTIIAGIGNIYADEILHLSRVNPERAAQSLSLDEITCMVKQIQLVLHNAIIAGGSSIRDYTDSEGINGNYQSEAFVYGREGQACKHCQTPIVRVKLGGRSSHYCPACQALETKKRRAK